jgi:hypothetical protein
MMQIQILTREEEEEEQEEEEQEEQEEEEEEEEEEGRALRPMRPSGSRGKGDQSGAAMVEHRYRRIGAAPSSMRYRCGAPSHVHRRWWG